MRTYLRSTGFAILACWGLNLPAASAEPGQTIVKCASQEEISDNRIGFYLYNRKAQKVARRAKVCVTSSGGFARMDVWDEDGVFITGDRSDPGILLKSADSAGLDENTCWKGIATGVQFLSADSSERDDVTKKVCVRLVLGEVVSRTGSFSLDTHQNTQLIARHGYCALYRVHNGGPDEVRVRAGIEGGTINVGSGKSIDYIRQRPEDGLEVFLAENGEAARGWYHLLHFGNCGG